MFDEVSLRYDLLNRVLTFGSARQAAPWRHGSHVTFEDSGLIVLSR